MAVEKSTTEEINRALEQLPDWTLEAGKLHRELKFKNFVQAFGFMTQVAILAERADHHPEWSNVYNRVVIDLTTHECDGISQRDFDLADEVNNVLASMGV